jgi:hypothetical protein
MNTFNYILPSSPIIEVASSLSSKQLSLLVNDPKYVRACQNRLSRQTIDEIITREYQNIFDCFKLVSTIIVYQLLMNEQRNSSRLWKVLFVDYIKRLYHVN